jgi:hypothetical protein
LPEGERVNVTITMNIDGLTDALKDLDRLDADQRHAVRMAIRDTAHDVERDAKMLAPVDTGTGIRGTIRTEIDPDGMGAQVGPRASWPAYIMEEGRKPGSRMPPVNALIPWVQRHGWIKKSKSKATYMGKSIAQTAYDSGLRNAAYRLARSIARKGICAKHGSGGPGPG